MQEKVYASRLQWLEPVVTSYLDKWFGIAPYSFQPELKRRKDDD